jgi:hypothetical protein
MSRTMSNSLQASILTFHQPSSPTFSCLWSNNSLLIKMSILKPGPLNVNTHPLFEIPPKAASDAIAAKYKSLGGANGVLGGNTGASLGIDLPVTDTDGWSCSFQNGEIYWFPDVGAHAIFGSIYLKWKSNVLANRQLVIPFLT